MKNQLYFYRKYTKGFETQLEFSEAVEIGYAAYGHKERGVYEFTLSEAIRVAKVLEITVEKLHELLTTPFEYKKGEQNK